MAKGTGISGLFRGKKGDGVFYAIGNAKSSSERQGWRQYQPRVKNPQTYAQAFQRMKMRPMIDCYNNLSDIIRRGFEGVPYGARSLMRFQQLNLAMSTGFPYVEKNSRDVCPGAYQISEGQLPQIVCTGMNLMSDKWTATNLLVDMTTPPTTVGQLDQLIINNNTNIQNGDQLTFINVITAEGAFYYRVFSFQLDTTDNTALLVDGKRIWHGLNMTYSQNGFVYFNINMLEDESTAAAAVIQSRNGNGVHLRSTAFMAVDYGVCSLWYNEDALNRAIASYMSSDGSTRSDWPVEPIRGLLGTLVLTNVGTSATSPAGGAQCLAWQADDDFYLLYIPAADNGKQLVGANGEGLTSEDKPLLYVGSGVSTMEYDRETMGHL